MTIKCLVALSLIAGTAIAQDRPIVEPLPHDASERVPVHTVVPVYPKKARQARVEGEVEVCFNVDRNGKPTRVAVRRSTNRVFEKPARDAVRASRYKPLEPGAEPSGIKTCRTFRFYLEHVAACSGNNSLSPASLAAQTPRSVIRPVTSRAGVTSKAGLLTGEPAATVVTAARSSPIRP